MVLLLPFGLLLLSQIQSGDPGLAARIQQLFCIASDSGDQEKSAAAWDEAKMMFLRSGLPSNAVVGDDAAYKFVWLNCQVGPVAFQRKVLHEARKGAKRHQIPDDAVVYCAAHVRQEIIKSRATRRAPSHPALREQIERLIEADQDVRNKAHFDITKMSKVDDEHKAALETIFSIHGVPTYKMVGVKAASDFATMIQHQRPEFRARVLPKLRANVEVGQADPGSYTKMFDRSQMDAGRMQKYGENLTCSSDNPTLHLGPIENEESVNQRRAAIGLIRIELYVQWVIKYSPDLCTAVPGAR